MGEVGLCELLDRAGAALLEMEEAGLFVSEFGVDPAVHAHLAELRRDELDRGIPLIVLGVAVAGDPALAPGEFALAA